MSTLRSSVRGALFTVACAAYATSAQAQCEITGRTVICLDSSVELCAPASPGYLWVDEEGNVLSRNQCITAVGPGTYRVYTYDAGLDVWWGPCVHVVSDAPRESCTVAVPPPIPDPPPPAPALDTLSCPKPASWWAKQCRREGERNALLDAAGLTALAQCIDARSSLFQWSDGAMGMCRTLRSGEDGDLRQRARRQFVAVLANLCASDAALTQRNGARYGLGPDAPFRSLFSGSTTVGAWATAADAELAQLQTASMKNKSVKAAYRRLFAEAWSIGHGVGLNVGCPLPPPTADGEDSSILAGLGPAADMAADLAPVAMPNPFHGSTRFAFSVPDAAGAEVDMAVFDVAGRRVASLARGRFDAGAHIVQWDGRGLDGSRARAGMYFVRGRIGNVDVTTSVMKVE
jgi:hypothetical protein